MPNEPPPQTPPPTARDGCARLSRTLAHFVYTGAVVLFWSLTASAALAIFYVAIRALICLISLAHQAFGF